MEYLVCSKSDLVNSFGSRWYAKSYNGTIWLSQSMNCLLSTIQTGNTVWLEDGGRYIIVDQWKKTILEDK